MHCFNLTAPYAVQTKLVALRLECVHYRLNWAEKGAYKLTAVYSFTSAPAARSQPEENPSLPPPLAHFRPVGWSRRCYRTVSTINRHHQRYIRHAPNADSATTQRRQRGEAGCRRAQCRDLGAIAGEAGSQILTETVIC